MREGGAGGEAGRVGYVSVSEHLHKSYAKRLARYFS